MTILNGSTTRPDRRPPDLGIDEIVHTTSSSNDVTALATWIIVTIGMGLFLQAGSVRTALGTTWALPVVIGLLFIVIGVVRAGALLHNAAMMMRLAREEAFRVSSDGESALDAWRCTEALLAGAAARDTLARRALRYAYGSAAAFGTWSIVVMLLTH